MNIILGTILLIALYIIYNLYNKLTDYKKLFIDGYYVKQDVINYYISLITVIHNAQIKMNKIDRKGYFKNDDETGFIFDMLNKELDTLRERLDSLNINDEEEQSSEEK